MHFEQNFAYCCFRAICYYLFFLIFLLTLTAHTESGRFLCAFHFLYGDNFSNNFNNNSNNHQLQYSNATYKFGVILNGVIHIPEKANNHRVKMNATCLRKFVLIQYFSQFYIIKEKHDAQSKYGKCIKQMNTTRLSMRLHGNDITRITGLQRI